MSMKVNEELRKKMVDVLSDVLNRICEHNKKHLLREAPATRFHATRDSEITIKFYLERVAKYTRCSEECFVLALIYLDRLLRKNKNFSVSSLTVHRLMITGIMIGAKFFDDRYFNNAFFGKVGGVTRGEMNLMEIEFLRMLNFDIFVDTDTFRTYNDRLMTVVQRIEHQQKGSGSTSAAQRSATTNPTPIVRASHSTSVPQQQMYSTHHNQELAGPGVPQARFPGSQQYCPGSCYTTSSGMQQSTKLAHKCTSAVRS